MNTIITILQLLPALLNAIKAIEEAIPMSGAGKAKADMVIDIITTTDETLVGIVPAITKAISVIVNTFNGLGVFKSTPVASPPGK